ncbi:MAG: hypothetical protein JWQ22_600 [Devosia sp.]|nr:hypothetical protein [Devosia sp.]
MTGNKMGGRSLGQHGAKGAGPGPVETFDEMDLASDLKNKASLRGGGRVHTREAEADVNGKTDSLIESFEKLDKDVRAERDLGKHKE